MRRPAAIRTWAGRLAAAAACLCATSAVAAPFVMQLGMDRLVLDTPAGFSDTAVFSSPRLADIAESHTPASNHVLVFAIADGDARRFASGDALDLRRYMIVATPRATERSRIGMEDFSGLMQEAAQALKGPMPGPEAQADFAKYLLGRGPGQPGVLAELKRDDRTISLLEGFMLPLPPDREKAKPMFRLSSASLALIGGKPLYISVFTAYDGPADLDWIRNVTVRWIDELRRLNR